MLLRCAPYVLHVVYTVLHSIQSTGIGGGLFLCGWKGGEGGGENANLAQMCVWCKMRRHWWCLLDSWIASGRRCWWWWGVQQTENVLELTVTQQSTLQHTPYASVPRYNLVLFNVQCPFILNERATTHSCSPFFCCAPSLSRAAFSCLPLLLRPPYPRACPPRLFAIQHRPAYPAVRHTGAICK